MASDQEIQAMANKYGWDAATVAEFKRRRDEMPDRDQDTSNQATSSQSSPTNQIILDPDKAQQLRQGMASLNQGGEVQQPPMIPPMVANKPMGPAPLQQPAPQAQDPNALRLAALQKLRGS